MGIIRLIQINDVIPNVTTYQCSARVTIGMVEDGPRNRTDSWNPVVIGRIALKVDIIVERIPMTMLHDIVGLLPAIMPQHEPI